MFGISGIALIIIAVAIAVPSGGWFLSSTSLRVCKAEHNEFVAKTESIGVVADLQGKLTNQKYENHKKDSDHEIDLARGSLLAYADRMRNDQKRPGRSLLPTPAPSTGNPQRTDYDLAGLVTAVGRYSEEERGFEREVTDLITEGAKDKVELDGVKKWANNTN
jgi:hypothetical protein